MLILLSPGFPENEEDSTCLPPVQKMVLALLKIHGPENLCILTLQYPFQARHYTWHGISVHALGGENKKGIRKILTWIKALRILNMYRKRYVLKGLLSFWVTETAFVAQVASRLFSVPAKFWIQGQDAKKENKYIRLIRPSSDQVLAISEFSRKEFYKNHKIYPAHLALNGILKECFPPLNLSQRNISVIGVGSLTTLKNYSLFLEVAEIVNSKIPGLTYLIAGEGYLHPALLAEAHRRGLASVLQFSGKLSHPEILNTMNKACVLLHTSSFEGSSTVIAEALYLGCSVVSTIGLSEPEPAGLEKASTKEDLAASVIHLLREKKIPQQVLTHCLDETARTITDLFTTDLK